MEKKSAFAPGRVELLGNHTDYNEGYVLSAAIQYGVTAHGRTEAGETVGIHSPSMGEGVHVKLDALTPLHGPESWANYVLGVVQEFRKRGYAVGGLEMELESDLPIGAGLSSSAALELATAKLLTKLFAHDIAPLDLAKICRAAENDFVGVNCGLLDQVSSAFGKAGHAVYLDCRSGEIDRIPVPKGLGFLVVHSGVKHALVGGEYNERREQCFAAAESLGVRFLRDTDRAGLEAGRDTMSEVVFRRALHIVGENERVREGIGLLRAGDGEAFGKLMSASHASSRVNFENSVEELDLLVGIALELPGVLGSRLTGGGFGGATVSLVRLTEADHIACEIKEKYFLQTGHSAQTYLCHAAEGAR